MSNFMSFIDEFGQQQAENLRSAGTARVMMMLGDFAFSIDTAAYNQLTREATWRWSEQERIGKQDLLQYTGKPGRTVRLEGESHAFFRKGVGPSMTCLLLPTRRSHCSWSVEKGMFWDGGW